MHLWLWVPAEMNFRNRRPLFAPTSSNKAIMPRVCMQVDLPHQFNFSLLIGFALSRAAKIEADTSFLGLLFTPDFLETTP